MDNIEQAKKWFKNLFMGCYLKKLDKYPGWIFWIYDENLIRQRKLSKITGIEKFNLDMSKGEFVFEQDIKNGWFNIKYLDYWSFLQSNFNLDYHEIKELTTSVVNELLNCKEYTTTSSFVSSTRSVNELLNCKEYTTSTTSSLNLLIVNDVLNCKEYKIN